MWDSPQLKGTTMNKNTSTTAVDATVASARVAEEFRTADGHGTAIAAWSTTAVKIEKGRATLAKRSDVLRSLDGWDAVVKAAAAPKVEGGKHTCANAVATALLGLPAGTPIKVDGKLSADGLAIQSLATFLSRENTRLNKVAEKAARAEAVEAEGEEAVVEREAQDKVAGLLASLSATVAALKAAGLSSADIAAAIKPLLTEKVPAAA